MRKVSYNLRVTEIATVTGNLIRQYQWDPNVQTDAFIKKIIDELDELSGRLTESIQRDTTKLGLDEADGVRDDVIRDLGTLLEGYTAIPFDDQKEAAYALKAVYDKYGKRMASEPFAVESALIESMLVDFGTPITLAAVSTLPGVAELSARLRSAQDAFNTASDRQTEANAGDKLPCATEIKKSLLSLLNERLIPYLNTMMMVNPDGLGTFARQVEVEIDRANDTVARRSSKGGEGSE